MSDLSLPRGDTGLYNLTITRDGSVFDLTGCTVFFTAKSSLALPDADAELKYNSNSGTNLVIAAGTGGTCALRIDKADSVLMQLGDYDFDVKVIDTNGYTFTPIVEVLTIGKHVTQRTA